LNERADELDRGAAHMPEPAEAIGGEDRTDDKASERPYKDICMSFKSIVVDF
jgi:hypothetical protein